MNTRFSRAVRFCAVWVALSAVAPRAYPQTPAGLNAQLYAGLTITGAVGSVYTIQYSTNLSQTNNWLLLTNLVLPSSPYLLIDMTSPAITHRFYRAMLANQGPPDLVWIPPGTFAMGSPANEEGRSAQEGPQTTVTLTKGFYICRYQVTQKDYFSLMSNNPSVFKLTNGYTEYLSRPVEMVTWFDANNYCAALTVRERAAGRLATNWVYRLPTEAEWEHACRAGTTTRFSYGDDPPLLNLMYFAWYNMNSGNQTHPVGQKAPNPSGLYDMHGNVFEWCQDYFGTYPGGSVTDPQGPSTGEHRVVRGGSWLTDWSYCRSASRYNVDPTYANHFTGFRVVSTEQP